MELKICNTRKEILEAEGHILIEGGPGSGKTTIALLKAHKIIKDRLLKPYQKVIFLSFARATISRIEHHSKGLIEKENLSKIEINTYHGYTWSLIKSYGYLISSQKTIKLLTPPISSAVLAKYGASEKVDKQKYLFENHGELCFDLFSPCAADLFEKSTRIRKNISDTYPVIIVDEFQDTNIDEWRLIKLLGIDSTIIALADLHQRIYDFRGASITRIPEFKAQFSPLNFDLGKENNRSCNTDIAIYGDDILTGENKLKKYNDVKVSKYRTNFQEPIAPLKYSIIESIQRLKKMRSSNDWSIAILVKSKLSTLYVSSALRQKPWQLPAISHEVLIDPSGPSLAASVIASMLEPVKDQEDCLLKLLNSILLHFQGRKGDKISQLDLKFADAISSFIRTGKLNGKNRQCFVDESRDLVKKIFQLGLVGMPQEDWLTVRKLFEKSKHDALRNVYSDAIYLRLLNKGAVLNEKLSEAWRKNNSYLNASKLIDEALIQEHFSMATRSLNGIFIMTIHKAKGKEFDEVIIWEDKYRSIVSPKATISDLEQAKLALRVAVTRARVKTTFLTSAEQPCSLL